MRSVFTRKTARLAIKVDERNRKQKKDKGASLVAALKDTDVFEDMAIFRTVLEG